MKYLLKPPNKRINILYKRCSFSNLCASLSSHLTDCLKGVYSSWRSKVSRFVLLLPIALTENHARMTREDRGVGRKLSEGGGRGGDRQDLIKDGLCYVISSERGRPHCCRDGEQLAWGCLIACSDAFQASSSGAHTRNGTDVYCWAPRWRLHGNHCLFLLLWSSGTSPSWDRCICTWCLKWAQLLSIYRPSTDRTAYSSLNPCALIWSWSIIHPVFFLHFKMSQLVSQFLILILTSGVIDSRCRLKLHHVVTARWQTWAAQELAEER